MGIYRFCFGCGKKLDPAITEFKLRACFDCVDAGCRIAYLCGDRCDDIDDPKLRLEVLRSCLEGFLRLGYTITEEATRKGIVVKFKGKIVYESSRFP